MEIDFIASNLLDNATIIQRKFTFRINQVEA